MGAQRSLAYRWMADDTEESIVGADWHQDAIGSLCNGLREIARMRNLPWHVGNKLTLVAWHPNGTPWRPMPDIMVHPQAGSQTREDIDARVEGLPALIIEVASRTTYLSDIRTMPPTRETQDAKGFEYLAWPLPEYLVFDPTEAHLVGQVRAWRVVEGQVQEWRPDADGRYHSRMLDISFCPEGFFLRLFDSAGNPVPFDHEQASIRERVEQRARLAEQARLEAVHRAEQSEQEIAALRALIEHLREQDRG